MVEGLLWGAKSGTSNGIYPVPIAFKGLSLESKGTSISGISLHSSHCGYIEMLIKHIKNKVVCFGWFWAPVSLSRVMRVLTKQKGLLPVEGVPYRACRSDSGRARNQAVRLLSCEEREGRIFFC